MKWDVIIVGQGLAGSVLALSFLEAGKKVLIIAEPRLSPCSQVAAGIWNPVVFKRLTKSWMVDDLLPVLNSFYTKAEQRLQASFITQRHILKFFSQEQEIQLWNKKSKGELEHYLDPEIHAPQAGFPDASFSKVLPCGNIDLPVFLEATRAYFKAQGAFLETVFDYRALQPGTTLSYNGHEAGAIVFCEGHMVSENPFFKWIPLKPAKGEVLTIQCEGLKLERDILNKGVFILPLGNDRYKVGATYEWTALNDQPTTQGLEELKQKLEELITLPYTILKHEAGIRPSALDRRPIIGRHPLHQNLWVFNGLGTKGVMLAPYFAQQFVAAHEGKHALDPEVDVARFYARSAD